MLAKPRPSGGSGPSWRCRGCSHPAWRLPSQAAPSFYRPPATGRRRALSSRPVNGASWRTQGTSQTCATPPAYPPRSGFHPHRGGTPDDRNADPSSACRRSGLAVAHVPGFRTGARLTARAPLHGPAVPSPPTRPPRRLAPLVPAACMTHYDPTRAAPSEVESSHTIPEPVSKSRTPLMGAESGR